ncbi:MAG: phospholipid/cholesterol/gamma-HCH transport system substrate-binding protein [Solirubrobacteraceae bacterium]|jgi:phospholipid/cholesterol/gamma-HCH transport system substrate-binding protein|nr:phospholipid/cholesterol/gamma-HCH transport system substrate-binding protein [Solirubrobacteraceae bacterium]
MSFGSQLRRYRVELLAVLAIVAVSLPVGAYIVDHQRLRFPWERAYTVRAEFSSAQAVTPGQGQNVTVAGVTVGEITSVQLRDGRAVVEMDMSPDQLPAVYADARMLLRPKTGLNDMSIELDPGTPAAGRLREDQVLPAARTTPNVNPDEVLAALDGDTRAYLATLLNAGGRGLHGRGADLRAVLRASAPTLAHTRRVTGVLADRRVKLRRLIGNLRVLSEAVAAQDGDLGRLVGAGDATFAALASQEGALRESLRRLPGTLGEAEAALRSTGRFAARLRPALDALGPAVRLLPGALVDVRPLLRDGEPVLRRQIRPLVRAARPLARDLGPTLADLHAVTPDLTSAFRVLVRVVNELAYNPPGAEEGYLFWLAWFAHNANSILSIEDAHGVAWRGQLVGSCSSYQDLQARNPAFALLVGVPACPS